MTVKPKIDYRNNVRSKIKVRWEGVADAPAYRVRYRKDGDTAWVYPSKQPRTADPWPNMHNAEPGAPNYNGARPKIGIQNLDHNERYEVQVASCTDTSCDSTGSWSASEYATTLSP